MCKLRRQSYCVGSKMLIFHAAAVCSNLLRDQPCPVAFKASAMGSSLVSSAYHWSQEEGTWGWNCGQTWLWQERHCAMSRLGDSCNCDDCGLGWCAENGVWKGFAPPTLEGWEEEWRKWEEQWKEEERAQTLVLLACLCVES